MLRQFSLIKKVRSPCPTAFITANPPFTHTDSKTEDTSHLEIHSGWCPLRLKASGIQGQNMEKFKKGPTL